MKSLIFGLFLLAPAIGFSQGETAPVMPMPEQIGVIYYFGQAQNVLTPLAKEQATVKSKARTLGFGGQDSWVELKGQNSSVRLIAGVTHEFVLRSVDPTRFKLYQFEVNVKEKRRKLLLFQSGVMNAKGEGKLQQSEIPLTISECGQSCFKLVPNIPLEEGEYALSPSDSNDTFSFSVVSAPLAP